LNLKNKNMTDYKGIKTFDELIKAGTKKSDISKIESAKGNIQLSTLIRILEKGLNRCRTDI